MPIRVRAKPMLSRRTMSFIKFFSRPQLRGSISLMLPESSTTKQTSAIMKHSVLGPPTGITA